MYPHDLRQLLFKLHDFISCFNVVKTSRPTFCENKAASWRSNHQENCRSSSVSVLLYFPKMVMSIVK